MQEVLQCLMRHGQRLDLEVAAEMRVPLATVRKRLAELAAAGDVVIHPPSDRNRGPRESGFRCLPDA